MKNANILIWKLKALSSGMHEVATIMQKDTDQELKARGDQLKITAGLTADWAESLMQNHNKQLSQQAK